MIATMVTFSMAAAITMATVVILASVEEIALRYIP